MTRREQVLATRTRFVEDHKSRGLCIDCDNQPKEGRVRCEACLVRRGRSKTAQKATAIQEGFCAYCFKFPKLPHHRMCERCYCRSVSYSQFKTTTKWQELLDKFHTQNGKCAISGVQMTLGKDIELDHTIPTSQGGSLGVENTQWVLAVCNRMKDNLMPSEFFGLIEQIYFTMKERQSET